MQDALPDTTLPIYLGLGQAIRNVLSCEPPVLGLWEVTGVQCFAQTIEQVHTNAVWIYLSYFHTKPDTLFSKIHRSLAHRGHQTLYDYIFSWHSGMKDS